MGPVMRIPRQAGVHGCMHIRVVSRWLTAGTLDCKLGGTEHQAALHAEICRALQSYNIDREDVHLESCMSQTGCRHAVLQQSSRLRQHCSWKQTRVVQLLNTHLTAIRTGAQDSDGEDSFD